MIEAMMREAVELLREELKADDGWSVEMITKNAVVDDADGDGRMEPNPDTGVGSEPGEAVIRIYKAGSTLAVFTESRIAEFQPNDARDLAAQLWDRVA